MATGQQVADTHTTVTKEIKDFIEWFKETETLIQKKKPILCTTKGAQDNLQKHYVRYTVISKQLPKPQLNQVATQKQRLKQSGKSTCHGIRVIHLVNNKYVTETFLFYNPIFQLVCHFL